MDAVSEIQCPFCRSRPIETAARARYVRGFLLAYQSGYRLAIGCTSCVRRELLRETGKTLLYGWFSPSAAVHTLIYTPWNLINAARQRPNRDAVDKALREVGVPDETALQRIDDVLYALMAGMVVADGRVDPRERVAVALLGPKLIAEFDLARLNDRIDRSATHIPVESLIKSVAPFYDDRAKKTLLKALAMIAAADGAIDDSEDKLLKRLRSGLGVTRSDLKALKAEALSAMAPLQGRETNERPQPRAQTA